MRLKHMEEKPDSTSAPGKLAVGNDLGGDKSHSSQRRLPLRQVCEGADGDVCLRQRSRKALFEDVA